MPRFPTYSSKGQLTTQQPKATKTGAGQVEKAAAGAFGTVLDIATKWKRGQEEMQSAALLARQTELAAKIRIETDEDTDVAGSQSKLSELKKGTEQLLSEVKNPIQRQKLAIQMNHKAAIEALNIERTYRGKQISQFQEVAVPTIINGFLMEKSRNLNHDSAEWKDVDKRVKINVDSWVANGLVTPEMKSKILSGERVMVAVNEILYDAEGALKNLKNEKYFPELTMQERNNLIGQAEKQIIQNKKVADAKIEMEEAKAEARWYSADGMAIQQYFNGGLTAEEIELATVGGKLSPQTGKAIASISWSKKAPRAKTNVKKYNSLLENYYKVDDTEYEKVKDWRSDVLAAQASGELNREDANELIGISIVPLAAKPTLKAEKNIISQALDEFRDFTTLVLEDPVRAVAEHRMAQSFFRSLTGISFTPENTQKAKDNAIAEEQKKHNPNRARYEEGKVYTSPKGTAFKVTGYDKDGEPIIEVQ